MPRLRDNGSRYERGIGVILDLFMGPTERDGELTIGQLEIAWEIERPSIMAGKNWRPGTRPWAWWHFDRGEEMPANWQAEAVRLAQLGALEEWEVAALRERAVEARLVIATTREHYSPPNGYPDRKAVTLWEAVEAVLAAQRAPAAVPRSAGGTTR